MKTYLLTLAVAAIAAMGAPALAFHDEGVAHCNGCHTMHNSQDGDFVDPEALLGNAWLLRDETPSDVCLSCHADRSGAVLSGPARNPDSPASEKGAGNFVFLTALNLNDGHRGATNPISGDAAGHNLYAPGFGLGPDATLSQAPGGTFPAGLLGCTSCHDPHGSADFRMLYGDGRPIQDGLVPQFTNPAPDAEGLGLSDTETNTNHTGYKGGMSAWCGNCHGNFHDEMGGRLEHPSGSPLDGTIAGQYGLYNGTSFPRTGTPASSYLAAVPYEDALNTTSWSGAPSASSQVSCITCHRAHGSSAPDSGRWDFAVTFLEEDGHESGSYKISNPYDVYQRSLCNKCHVKDEFDALLDGTPPPPEPPPAP